MSRLVRWDPPALSDVRRLERLDPLTADRVRQTIDRFAELGSGDVKKLKGGTGHFRLRVGDWRVMFIISDRDGAVVVVRVLNRRDAYRG